MNTCKICRRNDVEKIDIRIVEKAESIRSIAKNLKVTDSSLYRHAKTCIPAKLLKLKEVRKELEAGNINEQLNRTYLRAQKMSDACDKYLEDPNNPGEYYLGPRGLDVDIVYEKKVGDNTVTLKKNLQALISELEGEHPGIKITDVTWKHADPRKLLLEAAMASKAYIEIYAKMQGDLQEAGTIINVVAEAEQIVKILEKFPKARSYLVEELSKEYDKHSRN